MPAEIVVYRFADQGSAGTTPALCEPIEGLDFGFHEIDDRAHALSDI